jgi:hypothetical protein
MPCPTKEVRTLHQGLKITEEMEKNPTEKQINIAKRLRLVPSMLNSNVTKKREIQEHGRCRKSCKKRKPGGNLLSASLKVSHWF